MNYRQRTISGRLDELLSHFPVVVVSGARQVGKSTLLQHQLPAWNRVVLDPVIDVGNARSDPELFLNNNPSPLILDEVQYCPEVIPSIKRRVDEDKRPGLYVLTGSQQWSVLKSVSESLAGRAVFLDLEGFSLGELCGASAASSWLERYLGDPEQFTHASHSRLRPPWTLYEHIWRGSLPEMSQLPTALGNDFFAAYLRTYVERDARLMLNVEDWQQFGRFVQLTSALTAQEVNHSQLGRDIGITPQSAKRWLAVLKATFQWHEVPAFHGNAIKRISTKPKGYLADTGLACHLARITSPQALGGHPMLGALFETFVAAELRKHMAVLPGRTNLYHWRAHSGCEVDFLLERDGVFYPIEVKLGSRPARKDATGFHALRECYPQHKIAQGLVIAPVERFEWLTERDGAAPWDLA
jgi:predicted AAA+ superfamily ATPase